MKRRTFLFGTAFGTAAVSLFAQSRPVPYGAARIEDTDFGLLKASLRTQLEEVGIKADLDPIFDEKNVEAAYITHETADGASLENIRPDLDFRFKTQPPCENLVIRQTQLTAWRVFRPLHEVGHLFISEYKAPGTSVPLQREAFWAINGITNEAEEKKRLSIARVLEAANPLRSGLPPLTETTPDLLSVLLQDERLSSLPALNEYLVALFTNREVTDRMADALSGIYLLRNFGNARPFVKNLPDLRRAEYTDWPHRTASTLEAVTAADPANGPTRPSIRESALMAREIIINQPEFQGSMQEKADRIRRALGVMIRLNKLPQLIRPGDKNLHLLHADTPEADRLVQGVLDARNRACGLSVATPAP